MNNHQAIRLNIKPGDILLSRNLESPISKIIRGVTHSVWSHSALYIGDGKFIDATTDGVIIRSLDYYLSGRFSIGLFRVEPELSEKNIKQVIQEARKQLGIKYGFLQLVWQGILRLFGKSEDPDWAIDMPFIMICSEAIAKAYAIIGIKFKDIDPSQIEPVDLDESEITVRIA